MNIAPLNLEKDILKTKHEFMHTLIKKTKPYKRNGKIRFDSVEYDYLYLPEPLYDEYLSSFNKNVQHLITKDSGISNTKTLYYIQLDSAKHQTIIYLPILVDTYISYKIDNANQQSNIEEFLFRNTKSLIENASRTTNELLCHLAQTTHNVEPGQSLDEALRNFFMKAITITELYEENFGYDSPKDNMLINFGLEQREYSDLNSICNHIGLEKILLITTTSDFLEGTPEKPNVLIFFETNTAVYSIKTNTTHVNQFNEVTVRKKVDEVIMVDDIELSTEGLTLLEMMHYGEGLIRLEPNFEIRPQEKEGLKIRIINWFKSLLYK